MKIAFALIVILVTFSSCRDDGIGPITQNIRVGVEDIGVTDVWLRVQVVDSLRHRGTLMLTRNDSIIRTFSSPPGDTTFVDESLLPKKSYTYRARMLYDGFRAENSEPLTITTMDTTNHDFTWQIDTLGDGNSSALYDVAIINDTLVYAVGEIYKRDSTGQVGYDCYNLAKWNGRNWELLKIQFYTICGQSGRTAYPAKSVIAFSASDIWVAMDGSQIAQWDGTSQISTMCIPIVVNKLWGTSGSDIYAVGSMGAIAHYDGRAWQKMESGTDVDIQDIWGMVNPSTGERLILCAVSKAYWIGGQKILRIAENNQVDTVTWVSGRRPHSIWFDKSLRVHACGDGVFRRNPDGQWQELADASVLPVFTERLRGQENNDVFVVGDFGAVAHFNGVGFRLYPQVSAALVYNGLDYNGRQMVSVGYSSDRAIVLRMSR